MHKKELREKYLKLRNLSVQDNCEKIHEKLYSLPEYRDAESIFIYVSFGSETDTYGIIENSLILNKKIYVPRCVPGTKTMKAYRINSLNDLSAGSYGIPEPAISSDEFNANSEGLIICPGLCFTESGDRLGYGGGYYDRFLTRFKGRTPIAALCRESMITETVYSEKTDVKMDIIITDERIIRTK